MVTGQKLTTLGDQSSQDASGGTQADRRAQAAESLPNAVPSGTSRYDPDEVGRARAVIRLNLVCVWAWIAINIAAAWWLHNGRPAAWRPRAGDGRDLDVGAAPDL